jgi:type I restriction enzyme S subunit
MFLMTEGGDFDKLGRGTIWQGQIPICLHQNHIFRVRTDTRYLYPEFLTLISGSFYGKRFFILSAKQSTNLASINSTQLKTFPIPCPPTEEQKRILRALYALDNSIHTEQAHLDKIKLNKKGLVHDLLMGKARV